MDPCWAPQPGELAVPAERTRPSRSSRLVDWLTENDDLLSSQLEQLNLQRANPRGLDRAEQCQAVARVMISTVADVYGPVIRLQPMRAQLIASIAELLLFYYDGQSLSGSQTNDREPKDSAK